MSIVDDRMHVGGGRARHERLWQTPDGGTLAALPADATTSGAGSPGASPGRCAEDLFARVGTVDELWQARIELVVSSALTGDAARRSRQDDVRAQSRASFEAVRRVCQDELRPVLECGVALLGEWGLEARVTETLRDTPARVPRSFNLALSVDRFEDRGPGRLTITATEGCQFVRLKLAVGPGRFDGEVNEHVGTTIASDLSDALVGGLVATLVEQIFSS